MELVRINEAKLKVWILEPLEKEYVNCTDDPWHPWYDKTFGHIVGAYNEKNARQLAAKECGDEGEKVWLQDIYSTCKELIPNTEGIILTDMRSA